MPVAPERAKFRTSDEDPLVAPRQHGSHVDSSAQEADLHRRRRQLSPGVRRVFVNRPQEVVLTAGEKVEARDHTVKRWCGLRGISFSPRSKEALPPQKSANYQTSYDTYDNTNEDTRSQTNTMTNYQTQQATPWGYTYVTDYQADYSTDSQMDWKQDYRTDYRWDNY